MTRSAIIDHGRTQARHPLSESAASEPDDEPAWKDESDAEQLLASSMTLFVNALPEPYREALMLTELGQEPRPEGLRSHRAEMDRPLDVPEFSMAPSTRSVVHVHPVFTGRLAEVPVGGLTQKEAAERLGVSLSGMKSRVQRGRALVKKALLECCHIALDGRGRVMACEVRPDGKLPGACCGAPSGCGEGAPVA